MTRTQALAGAAIGSILVMAAIWQSGSRRILAGDTDFQAFYVSGQLVFRGQLYESPAFQEAERQILGYANPELLAVRPPFFAVAFWPLSHLPYRIAWLTWLMLLTGAIAGFIALWPDRRFALLACGWSAGLWASIADGQDSAFILLWLAIALRFRATRPFLAGLVLSLCAAKFHLFVFLPVLLWRHKLMRGFVAGGAALMGISFAAGGWTWPRQYLAILCQGVVSPGAQLMPNLHGLFDGWKYAGIWEWTAAVLVAIAVVRIVRYTDFRHGLAAVLVAGLLVSHHAYLSDCGLLIPVLLIDMPALRAWGRPVALWLLAPASGLLLLTGHPGGDLTRLAIVVLFVAMSCQGRIRAFGLSGLRADTPLRVAA